MYVQFWKIYKLSYNQIIVTETSVEDVQCKSTEYAGQQGSAVTGDLCSLKSDMPLHMKHRLNISYMLAKYFH